MKRRGNGLPCPANLAFRYHLCHWGGLIISNGTWEISLSIFCCLTNPSRVSLCIDNFPLESVRRTIHLIYPDYRSWRFAYCDESSAQLSFRKYAWTQSCRTDSGKDKHVNQMLNMFSFSPWTLSEEELQNFIRSQTVGLQSHCRCGWSDDSLVPTTTTC